MRRRCALLRGLLAGLVVAATGPFAAAQIRTDGTLGPPAQSLAGPAYMIGPGLGRQVGANLFHSFESFNLHSQESATFTSPAGTANIIGRVTGGQPSSVDGRIVSPTPGANLYLLNPSGWMFGAHAALDVKGSFHVSTADSLRFADGAQFRARPGNGSSFTAAPPAAFGFLTPHPAAIAFRGSMPNPPAGDLSIIGGAVEASGAQLKVTHGRLHVAAVAGPGEVSVASPRATTARTTGPIRLSNGTVFGAATDTGAIAPGIEIEGGDIRVENSTIFATGLGNAPGGDIAVKAGSLTLASGSVMTGTLGSGKAGSIRVDATGPITIAQGQADVPTGLLSAAFGGATGPAGDVSVASGDTITMANAGQIASYTVGQGPPAGAVNVTAHALSVDGNRRTDLQTGILSQSASAADSGPISVTAQDISLRSNGEISSSTAGPGRGGTVRINGGPNSTLTIDGAGFTGAPGTGILATSAGEQTGPAGTVTVSMGTINLFSAGQISTSTYGAKAAGVVDVTANAIRADGKGTTVVDTGIFSVADKETSGNAGTVIVRAENIELLHQGIISSSTFGSGHAGTVTVNGGPASTIAIDGAGTTFGTGVFSLADKGSTGPAGIVSVNAGAIALYHGGQISSSTLGSNSAGGATVTANSIRADGSDTDNGLATGILSNAAGPGGDAGNVAVQTNALDLLNGGQVGSSAHVGHGGSVTVQGLGPAAAVLVSGPGSAIGAVAEGLQSAGTVRVLASQLTLRDGGGIATRAASGGGGNVAVRTGALVYLDGGSITTSVTGGAGNGGNIGIDSQAVVLKGATVRANAVGGNGGNILISAGQYIADPDSVVEASSQRGIDGTIVIRSPGTTVTASLAALSDRFLQPPALQRRGCTGLTRAARGSSFILGSPGALPRNGDGPQPGWYFPPATTLPVRDADTAVLPWLCDAQ